MDTNKNRSEFSQDSKEELNKLKINQMTDMGRHSQPVNITSKIVSSVANEAEEHNRSGAHGPSDRMQSTETPLQGISAHHQDIFNAQDGFTPALLRLQQENQDISDVIFSQMRVSKDGGLPALENVQNVNQNLKTTSKQSPRRMPLGMQASLTKSVRTSQRNQANDADRNYENAEPVLLEDILAGSAISRREVTTLGVKNRNKLPSSVKGSSNMMSSNRYQSTRNVHRSNVRSAAHNMDDLNVVTQPRNIVTKVHQPVEIISQSTHGDQSNLDEVRDIFNSIPQYQVPFDSKFKSPMDLTINPSANVEVKEQQQQPQRLGPSLSNSASFGVIPERTQMQWQMHGRPIVASYSSFGPINESRTIGHQRRGQRSGRRAIGPLKSTDNKSSIKKRDAITMGDPSMIINMSASTVEQPGVAYHSSSMSYAQQATEGSGPYALPGMQRPPASNVQQFLNRQRQTLHTGGNQRSAERIGTQFMNRNQRASRTNQNFYPTDAQNAAQTIYSQDTAQRLHAHVQRRRPELTPLEGQQLKLVSKDDKKRSRNGPNISGAHTQGHPLRSAERLAQHTNNTYTTSTLNMNSVQEAGGAIQQVPHPQTVIIDEHNQMGRTFDEGDHAASLRQIEFYQKGSRQATSELRATSLSKSPGDDNDDSGFLRPPNPFPFLHESSSSLQINASPSPYQRAASHLKVMREQMENDESKMLTMDRSKLDGLLDKKYSKKVKRRIYDDVLEYADNLKEASRNQQSAVTLQLYNTQQHDSLDKTAVGTATASRSRLMQSTTQGTISKSNLQIAPQSTISKNQNRLSLSKDRGSNSRKRTSPLRKERLSNTAQGHQRIKITSKLTKLHPYKQHQELAKNKYSERNSKKKALLGMPKEVFVETIGASPRKSTPSPEIVEDSVEHGDPGMSSGPETHRLKLKAEERRSSHKKHFIKKRLSRKLAGSRSAADLTIKNVLSQANIKISHPDAEASYAEQRANSSSSDESSGHHLGSLALTQSCKDRNAHQIEFTTKLAMLQRSSNVFRSLRTRGVSEPIAAMQDESAYRDNVDAAVDEDLQGNIKALKGQINSTRFYLENVIIADSETKHRLFRYDQNLQAEAQQAIANGQEPPKPLPLGLDGQPQGQNQIVEVVQNNVPVMCKVELPPEVLRRKDARPVELRLRFRQIVEAPPEEKEAPPAPKMNVQGKTALLAMKFAKKMKDAASEAPAVKKKKKKLKEELQDLSLFVSAVHEEPSETTNQTQRYINQRAVIFSCIAPQGPYIYFTLKSRDGLKVKVSLEYLGEFALKTRRFGGQQDEDDEREKVVKPKYERFSILRKDGPFDYDCMDRIYPLQAQLCRNRQDKEKLFDKMIKELDEYYDEESAKIIEKQKKKQSTFITEGPDRAVQETPNFVNLNHYTQATWTQALIIGKLRSNMERRMFRQMLAMERREQAAARLIAKYKADAIKWDIYRERRLQAADFFIGMVHQHRKCCELIAQITLVRFVKKVQADFEIIQKIRFRRQIEKFLAARYSYLMRSQYLPRRGPTQEIRQRRMLCMAISFSTSWLNSKLVPREYEHQQSQFLPALPPSAAPAQVVKEEKNEGKKGGKKKDGPKPRTYQCSLFDDRAKPLFKEFLDDNWHANTLEQRIQRAGRIAELERRVTMASLGKDLRDAYLTRRIQLERDFLVTLFEYAHVNKAMNQAQRKRADGNKKDILSKLQMATDDILQDKVKAFIEVDTLTKRVKHIALQLPRLKKNLTQNKEEQVQKAAALEQAKAQVEDGTGSRKHVNKASAQFISVRNEASRIMVRMNDMRDEMQRLSEKCRQIVDTLYDHSEQVAEEQTVAARADFAKDYARHCAYLPSGRAKAGELAEFRREWATKRTVCSEIKKKKNANRAASKSPEKKPAGDSQENSRKSTKKGSKAAKEVGGVEDLPMSVPSETPEVRAPVEPCKAEVYFEAASKFIDKLSSAKGSLAEVRSSSLESKLENSGETLPSFEVDVNVEQLHKMVFSCAWIGLCDSQELQQGAGANKKSVEKPAK